ncbi:MAG: hypothetical protein WC536_01160 [Patescibacteria group bacterium]|jgi:hypothetical protein
MNTSEAYGGIPVNQSITKEKNKKCETKLEGGTIIITGVINHGYLRSVIHKTHLDLAIAEPEIKIDVTKAETIEATLFEVIFDYLRRAFVYEKEVKIITCHGSIIDKKIRSLIDGFQYELVLV